MNEPRYMAEYIRHLRERCGEGLVESSSIASDDLRSAAERETAAIRSRMSDSLDLPMLLEHRRQLFGITDGAFRRTPAFDRILVHQIGEEEGKDTYGDTLIHRPESSKLADQRTAPRGVLVSAGLKALDTLRSHGIDVGHIITFVRNVPWQMVSDVVGGRTYYVLVLRDGDIVSSEDTTRLLRLGYLERVATCLEDGRVAHTYRDCGALQQPWMGDDF